MARDRNQAARCPICGKPAAAGHRPFCSKRCADVDLNRWLKGAYVIAGEPADDDSLAAHAGEFAGAMAKN